MIFQFELFPSDSDKKTKKFHYFASDGGQFEIVEKISLQVATCHD